jgi:hypothetical protein
MTNTNTNSPMYSERVKFYADTPMEKNKLFSWELPAGILSLKDAIKRFLAKGWNIRACWYEKIDLSTGVIIQNTRVDLKPIIDEYTEEGIAAIKNKNLY